MIGKKQPSDRRVETFAVSSTDAANVPGSETVAHFCRGSGKRAGQGIVILPIQGAEYEVSTLFFDHFAKHGFSVLRFERRAEWLVATREPESLAVLLEAYTADVALGIRRWRELAPEVSTMGLFGVSMGAIIGTVVAAKVPDFAALVLVMGGGPLAEILGTARDEEINEFRRDLASRLEVPEAALEGLYRSVLSDCEPILSAPDVQIDRERILVIASLLDRVVRYPLQRRLWESLGRPPRMRLPCGHYWAVIFLPWIKRVSVRWFVRWLGALGL